MIEFLKELLHRLADVRGLVALGGMLMVCVIVFVETGLFVGFFLPGDSLLVTAGVVAADQYSGLKIAWLLPLVTLCAIAGDQLGYFIGRTMGQRLYQREDSRFFKKRHLQQAHEFYEKHGAKTIIMARFVPIIRTFCPPVAGAARMSYTRYLLYDICGGFLWVWAMVLLGYGLGRTVPNIDKRIHFIILGVIIVSFLPAAYHAWKAKSARPAAKAAEPVEP
jgi:membrane-associated protein